MQGGRPMPKVFFFLACHPHRHFLPPFRPISSIYCYSRPHKPNLYSIIKSQVQTVEKNRGIMLRNNGIIITRKKLKMESRKFSRGKRENRRFKDLSQVRIVFLLLLIIMFPELYYVLEPVKVSLIVVFTLYSMGARRHHLFAYFYMQDTTHSHSPGMAISAWIADVCKLKKRLQLYARII